MGIVSATYNFDSRRILVSREDERKAILALAEDDLLEEENRNEIKKLFLIAQKKSMSIPVMSICNGQPSYVDLLDGMPDNSIIDESIRLYREEVELTLK